MAMASRPCPRFRRPSVGPPARPLGPLRLFRTEVRAEAAAEAEAGCPEAEVTPSACGTSFVIQHKQGAPLRSLGDVRVTIVDDAKGVDALVGALQEYSRACEEDNVPPLVGMDCEWRPDFLGAMEPEALDGKADETDDDDAAAAPPPPPPPPPPPVVDASPAVEGRETKKQLTNRARRMREKLARRRQRRIERGLSPDAPPTARVKSDRKRQRGKNRKARIRSKDWNEVAIMQLATRERVYLVDMLALLPPRHVVGGPVALDEDAEPHVAAERERAIASVDRLAAHLLLATVNPHDNEDGASLASMDRLVLVGHGLSYDWVRLTASYATRVPSLMALRHWPPTRHRRVGQPEPPPLPERAPLLVRARTLEVGTFLRAAGRISGSQTRGLASLMKTALGITVDKSEQCSDWSRRPLSSEQVLYASIDAVVVVSCIDKYWRNVTKARAAKHAMQRAQARPGGRADGKAQRDGGEGFAEQAPDARWSDIMIPLTTPLRTGAGFGKVFLR